MIQRGLSGKLDTPRPSHPKKMPDLYDWYASFEPASLLGLVQVPYINSAVSSALISKWYNYKEDKYR